MIVHINTKTNNKYQFHKRNGDRMRNRLFVFVFLLFSANLLWAQGWYKSWGAGGSLGVFKMWGGQVDRSSISYALNLDGRYGPLPSLLLGVDLGYGTFKPAIIGTSTEANKNSPYRTFLFPVNITARYSPLPQNDVKPYVLAGTGLLFWDLANVGPKDGNFLDNWKFRWGQSVYGTQVNFALSFGAGFEWFVTKRLALDFEGRGSFLLGMKKDNVGEGDANDKLYQFKFGAIYYWGSSGDKDNDGIADKDDKDPLHPEDFDGFQDYDGAPDPDNDNDKVFDAMDGSPNTPEDIDGFQDDDGIPDPDNDGDGILDVNDKAPNEPEDFDGIADDDGAPEIDYDGDGINDDVDRCPLEPETFNNYMDDDGCPDVAPVEQTQAIPQQTGESLTLVGVNFQQGKEDLMDAAKSILDQVAASLIDNPQVRVLIVGYTDNTGSNAFNQRLSLGRAETVKKYLISKGVSENRLETEGRGSDNPVADNSTPEGQSINRRIEFIRLE
jgi:outer membrane protein OmpA-like peptidoglycan-associated protein